MQTSPLGRPHNFGPANDDPGQLVFGACRPGFPAKQISVKDVDAWTDFMLGEDVQRVVCLLASSAEFKTYRRLSGGLLGEYERRFGTNNVLHAPIRDFRLSSAENLEQVLAFLREGVERDERTVVHCAVGSGRTGHVLAAWLTHTEPMDTHQALAAIRRTGRNPYEAIESGRAKEPDLIALLSNHVIR